MIATGTCHSVREFLELAFQYAGMALHWEGPRGTLDEVGITTHRKKVDSNDITEPNHSPYPCPPPLDHQDRRRNSRGEPLAPPVVVVRVDPAYFRPAEVDVLMGDAKKAKQVLQWTPTIGFEALVREMVDADMARLLRQQPHPHA